MFSDREVWETLQIWVLDIVHMSWLLWASRLADLIWIEAIDLLNKRITVLGDVRLLRTHISYLRILDQHWVSSLLVPTKILCLSPVILFHLVQLVHLLLLIINLEHLQCILRPSHNWNSITLLASLCVWVVDNEEYASLSDWCRYKFECDLSLSYIQTFYRCSLFSNPNISKKCWNWTLISQNQDKKRG